MTRLLAWLIAAVLLQPGALPAAAQTQDEAAVLREAYAFISEYALRAPDPLALLNRAVASVQVVVPASAAISAPVLSGREAEDLEAVALYVAAIVRTLPPRQAELVLSAALRGLIAELADPLAAIFLPVTFARYMEELRGEHGGIGAQVDLVAGAIVIGESPPVDRPRGRDWPRATPCSRSMGGPRPVAHPTRSWTSSAAPPARQSSSPCGGERPHPVTPSHERRSAKTLRAPR